MSDGSGFGLQELGWSDAFAAHFGALGIEGTVPGRIAGSYQRHHSVLCERGEQLAVMAGTLAREARATGDLPTVGDWVALEPGEGDDLGRIRAVLPRRSVFRRKAAGGRGRTSGGPTASQAFAANVDVAFLVSGLDADFNLRRIERYVLLALDAGATPVIVLNKSDLTEEIAARADAVREVAPGAPVLVMSAFEGRGVDALRAYLGPGRTGTFLGSSGVGKSTIVNRLLGEDRQATAPVRESDGEGRHTTTRRELILLAGGGMVIDNPGMRELQVWADEDGLGAAFADIEEIAADCRFRDCTHRVEPGCAVRAAVESGALDAERLAGYLKLQEEVRSLEWRRSGRPGREARAQHRTVMKRMRRFRRDRPKDA